MNDSPKNYKGEEQIIGNTPFNKSMVREFLLMLTMRRKYGRMKSLSH